MVNINCPTAIYKILSYIFPLPSREPFDTFNFTDELDKASSSELIFNPKCMFICIFPMKRTLSPIVVFAFWTLSVKMFFTMKIFDKFPYFCRCYAGGEKQLLLIPLHRICCPLQWKQRSSDQEGQNNAQSQLPTMNSKTSYPQWVTSPKPSFMLPREWLA